MLYFVLAFFALPAFASGPQPITITPSGNLGGVRIQLPCGFPSDTGLCFVDTAGSTSIVRVAPAGAQLTKNADVGGIGWKASCQEGVAPTIPFAGETLAQVPFLLCPDFFDGFAPVIGVEALWGKISRWNFPAKNFQWQEEAVPLENSFPITATGPSKKWIGLEVNIGTHRLQAILDTGAPNTLVATSVVESTPELFELVPNFELPENLTKAGAKLYLLKAPLSVQGTSLGSGFVEAVDLKKIFGPSVADLGVIVGTTHLLQGSWTLDLTNFRGRLD